jgi:hypothetical protein
MPALRRGGLRDIGGFIRAMEMRVGSNGRTITL